MQAYPRYIDVHVDADWASSAADRRSTSGGAIRFRGAFITAWSRTQHVVALSYVAAATGIQEGPYFQRAFEELT